MRGVAKGADAAVLDAGEEDGGGDGDADGLGRHARGAAALPVRYQPPRSEEQHEEVLGGHRQRRHQPATSPTHLLRLPLVVQCVIAVGLRWESGRLGGLPR